jgi:hypothetical protein
MLSLCNAQAALAAVEAVAAVLAVAAARQGEVVVTTDVGDRACR